MVAHEAGARDDVGVCVAEQGLRAATTDLLEGRVLLLERLKGVPPPPPLLSLAEDPSEAGEELRQRGAKPAQPRPHPAAGATQPGPLDQRRATPPPAPPQPAARAVAHEGEQAQARQGVGAAMRRGRRRAALRGRPACRHAVEHGQEVGASEGTRRSVEDGEGHGQQRQPQAHEVRE
eukprot:scaffold60584_cov53-Phaeocystis_antarctica.AAC.4